MTNLLEALKEENYTLLVEKNETIIFNSKEKGIKSLYHLINEKPDMLVGANVVDTVVGKAAAMLYVRGNIKSLHAVLISEEALELLENENISVTYNEITPYITNRDQTGKCPMEVLAGDSAHVDELMNKLNEFFN